MWTERDESQVTCDGPLGAVGNSETVSRLLVNMTPPTGWRPFSRKQFSIPENHEFSNVCGVSTGCSVDRSTHLSHEQLQARSNSFADAAQALAELQKPQKIKRTGGGAITACVGNLREIKMPSNDDQQAVYVYADPLRDNPEHAVIRGHGGISEEEWPIILDDIYRAFKASK